MESKKKSGVNFFQMPLHYPRYTKKEYQNMPEATLDRLLAEYGLQANGDLTYKREFAMGAFLWPEYVEKPCFHPKSSPYQNFKNSFLIKKNA